MSSTCPPLMQTREHHDRVASLFNLLCGMAEDERRAYLDRHTELGAETVREALALIRFDTGDELPGPNQLLELPSPSTHSPVGSWIGKYRIMRKLGEGGLGMVYEAVRNHDGVRRHAAIKLLHPELPGVQFSGLLRREAQFLAALEHPNICRLYDWGRIPSGAFYLVMEMVGGESLRQWLARPGITTRERLAAFCSLCKAVSHAHRHHILHLDIKPTNIRFDCEGNIKLLDFSISQSPAIRLPSGVIDSAPWYSRGYTAPERAAGNSPTVACDIYSLGVVLGNMLRSNTPVKSARDVAYGGSIRNHKNGISSPSHQGRLWTEALAIVEAATAPFPASRCRSADDLRLQVERILDQCPRH